MGIGGEESRVRYTGDNATEALLVDEPAAGLEEERDSFF